MLRLPAAIIRKQLVAFLRAPAVLAYLSAMVALLTVLLIPLRLVIDTFRMVAYLFREAFRLRKGSRRPSSKRTGARYD